MDELYSGFTWVDHFAWRLTGTSEDGDIDFGITCPHDIFPLVAVAIEMEAQRGMADKTIRLDGEFAKRLAGVLASGAYLKRRSRRSQE